MPQCQAQVRYSLGVPTFRIRGSRRAAGVSYDNMRRWAEARRIEQVTDKSGRLAMNGAGLINHVIRDTVMAQVDIQAGPAPVRVAAELGPEPGMLAIAAVRPANVSLDRLLPAGRELRYRSRHAYRHSCPRRAGRDRRCPGWLLIE